MNIYLTKDEISDYFSCFGKIKKLDLIMNKYKPELNKGFCFISFYDQSTTENIIKNTNKKPLNSTILEVKRTN